MKLIETIILESINDIGLFKAVFLAGPPAAGKSTLLKNIYNGRIGPRVIDPDAIATIMAQKLGVLHQDIYDEKKSYKPQFVQKKVKQIVRFVNGMLPMYIDTTATDYTRTTEREEMLEHVGYDTMMIWLGTDIHKVYVNMAQRERKVPDEFIDKALQAMQHNYDAYQKYFGANFYVHQNYFMTDEEKKDYMKLKPYFDRDELSGDAANRFAYLEKRLEEDQNTLISQEDVKAATNKFLMAPIKNRNALQYLTYLQNHGEKYLTPGIFSLEQLEKLFAGW